MSASQKPPPIAAKFVSGSILRHILVMTSTSGIGLMALFVVDLADILFLSMLGDENIIAGIGFAATVTFFTVSVCIGISISMAALVSKSIGQQRSALARRFVVNIALLATLLTVAIAGLLLLNLPTLLNLLGASQDNLPVAEAFLRIVLPSLPLLSLSMALSTAIRSVGDAKLSMYITLSGGIVNAIFDPILIFGLNMGVEGAAWASVLARLAMIALAAYGIFYKHQLFSWPKPGEFIADLKPILLVAAPAMLTNLATPVGNAIVIAALAKFGGAYVAAYAVIGRIIPVAFGLIFAISGAIAPILGQNYGAKKIARVREVLSKSLWFNAIYVGAVSMLVLLLQQPIIKLFALEGEAARLTGFFCSWIAITYMFNGAQFTANSSFNNLGKPVYATFFNIGRATIGTYPFVVYGGQLGHAAGVLAGQAVGGMIFSLAAVIVAYWHIGRLAKQTQGQQNLPAT